MGFQRTISPKTYKSGPDLTADMIGIGMAFAGDGSVDPNIEDTLIAASIEGIKGDYRVLSLLTDWLDIHIKIVNADRLIRLVDKINDSKVKLFWLAVSQWKSKEHRFAKLKRKAYRLRRTPLNSHIDFQIKKYGEDERFQNTKLIVPKHLLRHRPNDIMPAEYMVKHHLSYKYRVQMGPIYRADIWATLERKGKDLSPSALARTTYSSISSASDVKKSWTLISGHTNSEYQT
jgi:hypothetical protein